MGAEASHRAGDYQEPELPPGVVEVRISVYKLELTGVGFLDHIGASLTGAYHSGLVVADAEWAFGGHDMEGKSGIYRTAPEQNPDYIFYKRVIVGRVNATADQIKAIVRQLYDSEKWCGCNYDLIERNCNHFVSDMCWALMKKRPPSWINSTADSMASNRRRDRIQRESLERALAEYRAEFGVGMPAKRRADGEGDEEVPSVPGASAFADAYAATFELAWNRRAKDLRALAASLEADCPPGEDADARRRTAEREALQASASGAVAAARAVAAAARIAAEAREMQPPDGLSAWDTRWIRESSALLRAWREEAAAGRLDPDPTSEQGIRRAEQVYSALAAAGEAAAAQVARLEDIHATVADHSRRAAALEGWAAEQAKHSRSPAAANGTAVAEAAPAA